jgi:tellurium resistance protein TerD
VAIKLDKDFPKINLAKAAESTRRFRVGMGWEESARPGEKFDLDVSMFATAPNAANQQKVIEESYMLFYNSDVRTNDRATTFVDDGVDPATGKPRKKKGMPATPCLGLVHTGDNQTGTASGAVADAESIIFDTDRIDPRVREISAIITIHKGKERGQSFGRVSGAYAKLYDDETGQLIAEFKLTGDFPNDTSMQMGCFYLEDGEWQFEAIGAGFQKDLGDFVELYVE